MPGARTISRNWRLDIAIASKWASQPRPRFKRRQRALSKKTGACAICLEPTESLKPKSTVRAAGRGLLQQTCWKSWRPRANRADLATHVSHQLLAQPSSCSQHHLFRHSQSVNLQDDRNLSSKPTRPCPRPSIWIKQRALRATPSADSRPALCTLLRITSPCTFSLKATACQAVSPQRTWVAIRFLRLA